MLTGDNSGAVGGNYTDSTAHALREEFASTYGGPEIPVPVERIAEELLGLRIVEAWGLDCSGMLIPAMRRIVLNAGEGGRYDAPLRRQRFTIAHELGHWVRHCVGPEPTETIYCRPVDVSNAADRLIEREANIFAAELLMPEPRVREAWGDVPDGADPVDWTARRFNVSPTAMRWRLFSFGLLLEGPA